MFLVYFPNLSTEEQDNYFLLCDVLPEDRVLREELQKQRLVRIVLKDEQCIGNTYKISFVAGVLFLFCFYFLFWKLSNIHKGRDQPYIKILKQKKVYTWLKIKAFHVKNAENFWLCFASWIISKITTELTHFSVILAAWHMLGFSSRGKMPSAKIELNWLTFLFFLLFTGMCYALALLLFHFMS